VRAQRDFRLRIERHERQRDPALALPDDACLRLDGDPARQFEVDLDGLSERQRRLARQRDAARGDVLAACVVIPGEGVDERRRSGAGFGTCDAWGRTTDSAVAIPVFDCTRRTSRPALDRARFSSPVSAKDSASLSELCTRRPCATRCDGSATQTKSRGRCSGRNNRDALGVVPWRGHSPARQEG